ncbi:hypothetical protein POTOM_057070 [Populus tomentosa]|uniref:Pentatricopeptide repeat-containing protein n=1 Tax=Populus tomentosa TaxID=118781 RepID=A0A8X7XZ18_POPTO|nr:hypothetical protein POTOM_057070 [Populus tomentosa]
MISHQCATDATSKNVSYQNTLWYYRAYHMWGADLLNVSCIYEPELFLKKNQEIRAGKGPRARYQNTAATPLGFAEQKDRRLRTGDWVSARKLFDEMPDRNGVTWACLIYSAIRACQESMLCGLQLGMQIHGLILKSPYANDASLSNVLISMYGKYLGYIDYARSVFDEIEIRNSIS